LTAQGLIDTTEMYLRTIFELEEEGVTPLRARIAQGLGQTGPTVSQTVGRMERDGLLHILNDRQPALSDIGLALATRVMRKHRLAECMLMEIIKLPWEEVHVEACRWEHVISEDVERRLTELLGYPVRCPHGNVIPGLAELGVPAAAQEKMQVAIREADEAMTRVASADGARAVIRRTGEPIQSDLALMHEFSRAGIQPGREVIAMAAGDGVCVTAGGSADASSVQLPGPIAAHIFVSGSSRSRAAAPDPAAAHPAGGHPAGGHPAGDHSAGGA
jgi:DtxR family transcriptional regulator, Mn-dependent transcriptional regulator